MIGRIALLLAGVAGLSGCLGGASNRPVATLADLPPAAAVNPEPVRVQPTQAIQAYRDYLAVASPGNEQHARALQRLADLMQAQLDARDAQSSEDPSVSPPSDAERESVADLYRQLLETYPRREANSTARYQLARTQENLGDLGAAILALDQLVAEQPDSPDLDEIHFRRGEYYFSLRDFESAAAAYAEVISIGPGSEFYEPSLYKRGWSQFRLQRFGVALDMFSMVLDRYPLSAEQGPRTLPAASRQRVDDTLDVMALSFGYQDGPRSIRDYFQRHGNRPWEALVYARLGEQYLDKQRYTDAAASFTAFSDVFPDAHLAPYFMLRAVDALADGGFMRQRRNGSRVLLRRSGLDQPYWNAHSRQSEPELLGRIQALLDELARYHHARAQARPRPDDVRAAIDAYRRHIDWFPDDPRSATANFLLAELLFETGDPVAAVAEYERSAYDYAPHADSAEAGYAALLAYQKAAENLPAELRPGWESARIESSLRFADRYRSDPRAASVLLGAARSLFGAGDTDRARRVAADVLQRFPRADTEIRYGTHLLLAQNSFDTGEFALAEPGFRQALLVLPAGDRRAADIRQRLAITVYRQGEQHMAAGRFETAAAHFLRVADVAPRSPVRVNADFDAAAAFLQARQWQAAIDQLLAFRTRYPGHELQLQVTRELAIAYLNSDQWLQAAVEFKRVAASGVDADLRREAMWQSADLFQKAGARRKAIDAWAAYVRAYRSPVERAMEARLKLLEIFRAANDQDSVRRWLAALIAADAKAGPERSDRTRYLAATAQLELAERQLDRFRQIALVAPIQRNIQRKRDAMRRGLDALGKALDYEVAVVTTAATFYTADIYQLFGRDLLASERPGDLDEEALEEYELLLEEQAYPFEEKAIEVHTINVERTADGIYDEWVRKSYAALARLVPARYAKEERSAGVMAQLD